MMKKSVVKKLTETLGDLVAATPGTQSDNEPMTGSEIAAAKAKKKTKGAADKRATQTAVKKTATNKKAKKSNR